MEEKRTQTVSNNLTRQVRCFSIGKENIRKLLNVLTERCQAACDLELANFKQFEQSEEEFQKSKTVLKESFKVRITVNGADGERLIGAVDDIVDSPNFPDDVKSIYIASDSILQGVHNYCPRNYFQIFLDFSKPNLLDFSLMPSQATPNGSLITVSGYDATWVHGLFKELEVFICKNPSKMNWIHKNGIYDLLVWLTGLPFGFWLCYKTSNLVSALFGCFSVFVQNAVYVYIFLISLFGFRVLFHYARWVYPTVEYCSSSNKALSHRRTLIGLIIGVLGSIIGSIIWEIW